jgi:galactarate dehydratase
MASLRPPLAIRMHAADNVAIIANDGGLPGWHSLAGRCG